MKRYYFMVKKRKGKLEDYSIGYRTASEAYIWYSRHGKWLEDKCNRNLIFVKK